MNDGVGLLVVGVPVGMFLHPGMIPCRMVSHPVEDETHAVLMADIDEVLEVVDGTKLRGDSLVITDTVRRILALLNTDGIDGHHPHHVDTQIADRVDACCHSIQGFLRCKHTGIDLIHGDVFYCWHLVCHLLLCWLAGNKDCSHDADG